MPHSYGEKAELKQTQPKPPQTAEMEYNVPPPRQMKNDSPAMAMPPRENAPQNFASQENNGTRERKLPPDNSFDFDGVLVCEGVLEVVPDAGATVL